MTTGAASPVVAPDWFDELEFDPAAHPVSMATRALGDRPWFVFDAHLADDLTEKRRLLAERRDEVAWFTKESEEAAAHLVDLMAGEGLDVPLGAAEHPLEAAALAVHDDLVLLRRIDGVWHHDASVVCFPTYWPLPAKVARPVTEVHAPVAGYAERIADKVSRLFDRVNERGVWRRNWGLTADPTLFQPQRRSGDPQVPADRVWTDLHVRSERQTLRRLGEDWIVFAIRIQIAPLGRLVDTDDRRARLRGWVNGVPADIAPKRHLSEPQRAALLTALT